MNGEKKKAKNEFFRFFLKRLSIDDLFKLLKIKRIEVVNKPDLFYLKFQ